MEKPFPSVWSQCDRSYMTLLSAKVPLSQKFPIIIIILTILAGSEEVEGTKKERFDESTLDDLERLIMDFEWPHGPKLSNIKSDDVGLKCRG